MIQYRDATLFEGVANHSLLTAEPKNYAMSHSSGETSIICFVVLVNWSSKYNILPFFLLFLEDFFVYCVIQYCYLCGPLLYLNYN